MPTMHDQKLFPDHHIQFLQATNTTLRKEIRREALNEITLLLQE